MRWNKIDVVFIVFAAAPRAAEAFPKVNLKKGFAQFRAYRAIDRQIAANPTLNRYFKGQTDSYRSRANLKGGETLSVAAAAEVGMAVGVATIFTTANPILAMGMTGGITFAGGLAGCGALGKMNEASARKLARRDTIAMARGMKIKLDVPAGYRFERNFIDKAIAKTSEAGQ